MRNSFVHCFLSGRRFNPHREIRSLSNKNGVEQHRTRNYSMTSNSLLLVNTNNYRFKIMRNSFVHCFLSGRRFNPPHTAKSVPAFLRQQKWCRTTQNKKLWQTSNWLLLAKQQLLVQNYAELIRTLLFKRSSAQSTPRNPFLK